MEQQTNTTDALQNKSEKVELERYEVITEQLIEAAQEMDANQRLDAMRILLSELRSDAKMGYVKGSTGKAYDQASIDRQLFTFADQIQLQEDEREPEYKDVAKLIPNSEGLRAGVMKLMKSDLAKPLLDAIAEQEWANNREREARVQHVGQAAGERAVEAVVSLAPDTAGEYDHLFDPSYEGGDVEAARVPETEEERLTRERRWNDERQAALDRVGRKEMN